MSYKRNQRKKTARRKRQFPHLFKAGVPTGSWNVSRTKPL